MLFPNPLLNIAPFNILIHIGHCLQVSIGKIGALEVDFIAERMGEKAYYQVAASVLDEHTLQRELTPLQKIPDQYPKYLLTMDRSYIKDYEGIRNVNIIDFLLGG